MSSVHLFRRTAKYREAITQGPHCRKQENGRHGCHSSAIPASWEAEARELQTGVSLGCIGRPCEKENQGEMGCGPRIVLANILLSVVEEMAGHDPGLKTAFLKIINLLLFYVH